MPKDIFTAEWFPYYFERFEGSARVAVMSLAEEGGYHKAIRIAWKYGSVPSDPALLAAMIQKKCTPKMAAKILEMFEPMPGVPSRAIHPTVEEIRAEQERKYLRYKKGGEMTAEKRWGERSSVPPAVAGGDVPPSDDSSAIAKLKPGDSYGVADRDREQERDSERESFFWTDRVASVRACEAYAAIDPRLVEIAVIKTLITHRNSPNPKPIKNLPAYCREEIEGIVVDAGTKLTSKTIDAMLHSHRLKAEKYLTSE